MTRVTILLPTRNRADTLAFALQTLLRIDDDRLEILVSDNASEDDTREVVLGQSDARLRYINPGRRLGMSQHWEFALAHATGDWLGFMGDDDGMLPDTLERLRAIVAETGVEAVRAQLANYTWPSLSGRDVGVLHLPVGTGVAVQDSAATLRQVLAGRLRYTRLPVLYNGGFASRQAIERAKAGRDRFFRSRIPDIYSGVVLCGVVPKFAWSERPFTLNGASIHSTGTATFTRSQEPARLRSSLAFMQEDNLPFHPAAPLNRDGSLPRSLEVLVLESWYQARELFPDLSGLDPQAQLAAIYRSALQAEDVAEWVEDYAALHGLDSAALGGAALHRSRSRAAIWLHHAWSHEWHSGLRPAERITDVAAATRLAAEILAAPPLEALLPLRNVARMARKAIAAPFRRRRQPGR
jgi:hypothetical protein